MPRKKVCKTVKGKRICNKKPQMRASDIISLQMNALQKNKNDKTMTLVKNEDKNGNNECDSNRFLLYFNH